jgi:tetratricopeptide (TPR) repeat protein
MNPSDLDEQLRRVLDASERGDTASAIARLSELHTLRPDARAAYLLGAEFAQMGVFDAAEAYFREAVRLDPTLGTAHLQLGLLLLTQARVDEAMTAWQGLDDRPDGDPLQLFRAGLQHLARDEFASCLVALRDGMRVNTANVALNSDMQRIVERIEEVLVAAGDGSGSMTEPDTTTDHLLLSAYRGADGKTRH